MRRLAAALLLSALMAAPALAADGGDDIDRLGGRVFDEQMFSLFFGLMRQSMMAALEGKPPPELPPEVGARMEKLGRDLRREMLSASVQMLDRIEKEMREELFVELPRR